MPETYKPTEGMATAAKRALKWKDEAKAYEFYKLLLAAGK